CRAVMEGPNPERKIKLMNNRSCLTIFTTILSVLACFAFSPQMQATVCPPEIPTPEGTDGAYPNFATAEGFAPLGAAGVPCTGLGNTAIGWQSLFFSSASFWNTGVGAGALAINTGDENTATGAGALLINLGAFGNTANGAFALFKTLLGFGNTAVGDQALMQNAASGLGLATTTRQLALLRCGLTLMAVQTLPLALMRSSVTLMPSSTPQWVPARSRVMTS